MYRKLFILSATLLLVLFFGYFLLSDSYEQSLEARLYFAMGEYDKAYERAYAAHEIEPYNKMAATMMAQSKIAREYEAYNKQAKTFYATIVASTKTGVIDDAQKARIKMMSEIVIESYSKLAPSVMTPDDLVEQSRYYYEQFTQLNHQLSK